MTTETVTPYAEITTNCTCEAYDEDTDTYTEADTCKGYCGEDQEEWTAELIEEWLTARGLEPATFVKIEANGLGWLRRSGYKLCRADSLELARALYLDGDFTIRYELDGDKLTARRWSHDEPVGSAVFEFEPVSVCAWSECFEIDELGTDNYGQTACSYHIELSD